MSSLLLFALFAQGADPAPLVDETGLTAGEALAAEKLSQAVGATEFLGPLAPVALSPFFGIACLSGLAQFGPDSLGAGNAMLSEGSPLRSPLLLVIFGGLAVLTSLPRLTKVSKPIAGALDQIEAWSGIITMVVIKFLIGGSGDEATAAALSSEVQIAGIGTVTLDTLLAIGAAANIFVVNSVKFFFEFLIWITPVPFLDACFEAANKALCAGLMAIYAFSPTVSLAINAVLFAVCLVAFVWIQRQITFFRTMLFDWLVGWFRDPPEKHFASKPVTVFPKQPVGPFAAREKLLLVRTDDGWVLRSRPLVRSSKEVVVLDRDGGSSGSLQPGWAAHTLLIDGEVDGQSVGPLLVSRRYRRSLAKLAETLRLELVEEAARDKQRLRAELGQA